MNLVADEFGEVNIPTCDNKKKAKKRKTPNLAERRIEFILTCHTALTV